MRTKYLICVDPEGNRNKFFEATENDDHSIDLKYGIIGGKVSEHHFKPYEKNFDDLINTKLNNNFKEKTALHIEEKAEAISAPINEADIRYFIEDIIAKAREFVQKNYTISHEAISNKMLDEAQLYINEMSQINADYKTNKNNSFLYINSFNDNLIKLFTTVPRRMTNVSDFIAKSTDDFDEIIEIEQDMIDNLRGQIKILNKDITGSDKTILEKNGIEMISSTYDDDDYIIEKLAKKNLKNSSNENRFIRSYKVYNEETEKNFKDYCNNKGYTTHHGTHFYFHGTKLENLWSIFRSGLSLNPNAVTTGKAFGQGLYFAEHSSKSLGYTSIQGSRYAKGGEPTGWLLMYEVATGKSLIINNHHDQSKYNVYYRFNKNKLNEIENGKYDSVYAVGQNGNNHGVFENSEIMIYDEHQCTVRYILEVTGHDQHYSMDYKDRLALRFDEGISPLSRRQDGSIMAEVEVGKLTKASKEILKDKILSNNANIIILTYKDNKISLLDNKGNDIVKNSVTNSDKAWIARQFKRCFAENDKDFDKTLEKFNNKERGKNNKIDKDYIRD